MSEDKANGEGIVLDLRGYQCPLPVLKTRHKLRQLEVGSVIYVLSDDPLAGVDIPHLCNESGQDLLAQEQGAGESLRFTIRRTAHKI